MSQGKSLVLQDKTRLERRDLPCVIIYLQHGTILWKFERFFNNPQGSYCCYHIHIQPQYPQFQSLS